MTVVKHDGQFFMFAEGANDQAHWLTSLDGVSWDPRGPINIRTISGEPIPDGPHGTPSVWVEDGVWWLFYERKDAGIWLAKSTDLHTWTHVDDEPVIRVGQELYNYSLIALNQVLKHDGLYYALLQGREQSETEKRWSSFMLMSDDLKHWFKYWGNPITSKAENKSSPIMVHDGTQYRLYTMHGEVKVHYLHTGETAD